MKVAKAEGRVYIQKACRQVDRTFVDWWGCPWNAEVFLALNDTPEYLLLVLVLKGRFAHEKLVHEAPKSPMVHTFVVAFVQYELWGEVFGRTAEGKSLKLLLTVLFERYVFREPKINYFDVSFCVHQQILWLKIAVHDVQRVDVTQGKDNTAGKELGVRRSEPASLGSGQ